MAQTRVDVEASSSGNKINLKPISLNKSDAKNEELDDSFLSMDESNTNGKLPDCISPYEHDDNRNPNLLFIGYFWVQFVVKRFVKKFRRSLKIK